MYSMFYYMGEAISTIIIAVFERLYPHPFFKEEISIGIFDRIGQKDGVFVALETKYLPFRPRLMPEGINVVEKKERVYTTWKELASDKFFEDVEKMFERMERKGES